MEANIKRTHTLNKQERGETKKPWKQEGQTEKARRWQKHNKKWERKENK